ncbi:1-phosphofructokinase family hexose kinase [Cohnella luojiensis]|uniref:Tagatose-6-phosphate kinase n=1 Tax=Cohnella luojiensis TaxID=652876 RepID=A0A4Y8M7D3_9BACL|nr:1-phosphofructokinase family hexose kinase [Cohnella luojiensis]TFE30629.1 1-phosphofructokinase family hexose kinase [Cohnella luojiensis]
MESKKRKKITTVTLNAAIDKTYYVPTLVKGTVMRAESVLSAAGGKGVNVARVLRQLGHTEVAATGFASGYNGKFIIDQVKEIGIEAEFVEALGESRLCLNFIDRGDGTSTEILEPGPDIREKHLDHLKRKLHQLAQESALVIFSGSIPKGLHPGLYAQLIGIARAAGAEVFLDASGKPLSQGLLAKPSFIKPNEEEIVPLLAGTIENDLYEGVVSLMNKGIANVVVTLGGEGAVAGVEGKLYRVQTPKLKVVNTVGCGDAFVAGYAYGFARNWPAVECLQYAAAAGCANALSSVAGDVRLADHQTLLREVRVEAWNR